MDLKTLWKSICALILGLLITMAFIRRPVSQWIMIGIFALWAVFVVIVLVKNILLKTGRTIGAFLLKNTRNRKDEQTDASQLIATNRELKIALLNQIVFRITENLKYHYPDAVWKWAEKNPLERILEQESCRITISNVKDFNFADIQIDTKGNLNFEFGKKVTLEEIKQGMRPEASENTEQDTVEDWFYKEGNRVLNSLVCELNAAGHSKFFISANGEISVIADGKHQVIETEYHIPAVSLAKLKDLLKTIRLNSEMDGNKLAITV